MVTIINSTNMKIQFRSVSAEAAAARIVREIGTTDAFSTEMAQGLTVRQAREAMNEDADAWLTVNGWITEYGDLRTIRSTYAKCGRITI